MDCRVLVRFIGEEADLALLWQAFMEKFPEAEISVIFAVLDDNIMKQGQEIMEQIFAGE